ncbi:SAM-dependent methyltransferase [Zhengella mangrovi]|uniref:SAM-dependent methyltransferase n=1 Tax=Zhengella mangrovi TaxID=1982044 RepID=A0A2G1QR89_9HYPH|nr:cyclopropane-fatty-acyl-phospholipid synthase family protein [Zhengella mangrovi]PHP68012.1 SAM-dependent methyltransferase [Zhengella mangrovi]
MGHEHTVEDVFDGAVPLTSPADVAAAARGLPGRIRAVLKTLVNLPSGTLAIRMPDGRAVLVGGNGAGPDAQVVLHNWNLPMRAITGGTIGVAESYMAGDWDSPDVTTFLELFIVNTEESEKLAGGSAIVTALQRLRHWFNRNSRTGSRRNIAAHYDLGNAFYREWLDETMTYSSALYATGANDLASAQRAKYHALIEDTGIRPGDHVLEIGCGWGGFAEQAGKAGARVTALTISREQHDFAARRIHEAGLAEQVEIRFQDYRDEAGRYDRVASIEMFEAVGEEYWPVFFNKVREVLRPGGTAGLQIITINDDAFPLYRKRPDFIQRYVFPGGMLPSPSELMRQGKAAGLSYLRERIFPQDYARTLAEWRRRFHGAWDRIAPLGFDTRFRRLWEFYLYYCEAGFRSEYIDVRQVVYRA